MGDVPKQLEFCSTHVHAGWRLRKLQESKTVISEAGHTLTQLQVPSTSSEEKFPSVFLSFGSTYVLQFSLFSDASMAQGQG